MQRTLIIVFLTLSIQSTAQKLIGREQAVELAFSNQRNLQVNALALKQQQELLRGSAPLEDPEVFLEASPYEGMVVGAQQSFALPGAYRSKKALQSERIRLAELQLKGSQYELEREVRLNYLQLQYLTEKQRLLRYQDSIYQSIKLASKRFFDAGQINKLEELQATTQADGVRNELVRVQADLVAEREIFQFFTAYTDSPVIEPIDIYLYLPFPDTTVVSISQEILKQEIAVSVAEWRAERSELLPKLQAGVLFPTTNDYERPVGYQLGVTIPIWRAQNRARVAAAKTGVDIARAQQDLERQRLNAQVRQAVAVYDKERQSLEYFNNVALPQARAIVETSQRLFHGGELNYVESLRNLELAFEIYLSHLETHRAYNESVIQLQYLNGIL